MRSTLALAAVIAACSACSVSHVTAGDGEPGPEPDPDLVAFWSFEEGAGDVVTDSVSAIELARSGPSWDPAGRSGGALSFDGADDYLELEAPGELLDFGTGDFTFTAWLKNRGFGAATGAHQFVLGRGVGSPPQPGYRFYFQWTDFHHHNLTADIADGVESTGLSPERVGFFDAKEQEWIFVAATRRGTELAVYVDAVIYNSEANAITGDIDVDGELNDRFRIGALPYQALWPFDGWIDEVRVYRRALDEEELGELMELD